MIEVQIISKILEDKTIDYLIKNNITIEYFISYKKEAQFIYEHYNTYSKVPTKESFIGTFTEFEFTDAGEEWQYLVVQLREEFMFSKITTMLNTSVELVKDNALEGYEFIKQEIDKLSDIRPVSSVDIVSEAQLREKEYLLKVENESDSIIKTGLPELDNKITGWNMGEELVTVMARTNQGKSWILVKFLMEAWKQGKRVGLYSGEMSATQIGFRFDALFKHYSNLGLIKGDSKVKDEYSKYINDLREEKNPFVIITPKELGHRATVNDIDYLVKKHNLDIVGIDQYSLMEDWRSRSGEQLRIRLGNISADLFNLSMKYKIPIIALSQANREAVKSDKIPELEHMSESDAIAQNSTKVITMGQVGGGLKMSVVKNRYGPVGAELVYAWDIDTGEFIFMADSDQQDNRDMGNTSSRRNRNTDEGDAF